MGVILDRPVTGDTTVTGSRGFPKIVLRAKDQTSYF